MMRLSTATVVAILLTSTLAPAADPPRVVRENIEWLDVWVPGIGVKDQSRVLLIGDSITPGDYKTVEDKLNGKAIVCLLTTNKIAIGRRPTVVVETSAHRDAVPAVPHPHQPDATVANDTPPQRDE